MEGSIRIDPASSGPAKAHIRTYELDDYVKWLRQKIKSDQAKEKLVAEQKAALEANQSDKNSPLHEAAIIARESNAGPSMSESYISEITAATNITAAGQATTNLDAVGTTSAPITELPTAPILANQQSSISFSANDVQRVDQPHQADASASGMAAAHLHFDEAVLADANNAEADGNATPSENETLNALRSNKLSTEDTEEFIATVSKAIASVLTDMPEVDFEQKVRAHFETELHARAIQPVVTPEEIKAVDTMDKTSLEELVEAGGRPVLAMQSEAKLVASEIARGSKKEIPTNVAAWDVEDFRWPAITNQMIVSGGEAIDAISRSAFDIISSDNQRLMVAGLGRGEGTTSIAISLARWSAACGKNVLLVDADLVSPELSSQVGLAPNMSWINAVSQSLPASEVIIRSQKSNLCIMPLAQMVSRVTWPRFIYDNLGEVLNQVRSHFDLIILDVGPANQMLAELSRADLLVDAALLVHNGIDSPEFQKTKGRLETFGLNKFIVAQNQTHTQAINVA